MSDRIRDALSWVLRRGSCQLRSSVSWCHFVGRGCVWCYFCQFVVHEVWMVRSAVTVRLCVILRAYLCVLRGARMSRVWPRPRRLKRPHIAGVPKE